MVARATEGIRDSLMPIIQDASAVKEETVASYAKHIIEGISEVRELIYVMLKGDDGIITHTDHLFTKFVQSLRRLSETVSKSV